MHNFKVGDLALVIKARIPENLGKVVEVVRISCDYSIGLPDGKHWVPNESGSEFCVVTGELLMDSGVLGRVSLGFGAFRSVQLMPLRGNFKPEEDDLAEYADTSFYDLRTGRQHLLGGRA